MKKTLALIAFTGLLALTLASCGSDDDKKDEPTPPSRLTLESVTDTETGARIVFEIYLDNDSSTIYVYNAVITANGLTTAPMNVRVNAPCKGDNEGKVFTYSGTGLIPQVQRGSIYTPQSSLVVTDFTCVVNTIAKTYSTQFDCLGKHYFKSGALK